MLTTAEQLAGLARLVDDKGVTFKDKTIELGSDIDLSSVCGKTLGRTWLPIGWTNTTAGGESVSAKWSFQGTFDGGGHSIKNLYVDQNISSIIGATGLFGSVCNATLKNFSVSGKSTALSGGTAAGVAGVSTGTTFEDIASDVDVTVGADDVSAAGYAGGITAYVYDDEGRDETFKHLTNKGDVKGDCKYIGGIVGYLHMQQGTAYVYACVNEGKVSGAVSNYTTDTYTGGVIGSTGNSNGTGDYVIAGCSNSGDVSGSGDATGGIVGRLMGHDSTSVSSSYNTGDVSSEKSSGGIVGSVTNSDVVVSNNYNVGGISGASSATGGIVGASGAGVSSDNFSNNYTLRGGSKAYGSSAVSKGANNTGTSKSSSEMKRKSFLKDLNSDVEDEDVQFVVDDGYPVNSWQVFGFGKGDQTGGSTTGGETATDSSVGEADGGAAVGEGAADSSDSTVETDSGSAAAEDSASGDSSDSVERTNNADDAGSMQNGSLAEDVDSRNDVSLVVGEQAAQALDNVVSTLLGTGSQTEVQDNATNVSSLRQQSQDKQTQEQMQQVSEQSSSEDESSPQLVEVEFAAIDSTSNQSDSWDVDPLSLTVGSGAVLLLLVFGFAFESVSFKRRRPAVAA